MLRFQFFQFFVFLRSLNLFQLSVGYVLIYPGETNKISLLHALFSNWVATGQVIRTKDAESFTRIIMVQFVFYP